jgi:3-oxoadipate enol-lactonase
VRVGDVEVAYRFDGPDGAPVVMLAHGLLTSHRIWDGLVRILEARWRVLRYDLRGHGSSSATPGVYSMEQLAGDAVGLLDALDIARAHFIGISLGGMIGQQLGARHPSRFVSLTLANTAAVQPAAVVWQQRIQAATAHGVAPIVQASLQRWFTPEAFATQPELISATGQLSGQTSLAGFVGCASAVRDLSQRDILPRILLPTLVVAGAHDQATTPAEARVLVEGIAGAVLATLPAAHQSAVECPLAFANAWLEFQAQGARTEVLA